MSGTPSPCESLNALKIAELEKRLAVMLTYSDKAVEKAAHELSMRLEHSNGLIALLKAQTETFITRKEMAWIIVALMSLITLIAKLVK